MKKQYLLTFIIFLFVQTIFAQVELVPVSHKIYPLLNSFHKRGIIENYNNANIPLSRKDAAVFLNEIKNKSSYLTSTEMNILDDLLVEFNFDLEHSLDKSISLLSEFNVPDIFNNDKQKYLYAYADSNASLFFDGTGFVSHRRFEAESFEKTSLTLGEFGFRLRGTLYNNVGFYLRASTGQQINGDTYSRIVSQGFDPKLHSTLKFIGEKYFETYEGYLRYQSGNNAFAVTLGREAVNMGTGYIDKLLLGNNAAPFDFGKLDIAYKGIKYSFLYGNLRGDSLGVVLESKNIIGHRLDFSLSNNFRFGVYEVIFTADRPISFTYLNPVSFLFSADLTAQNDNTSNSLLGFDVEILPFENVGLQSSLFIDDYDFKLIGEDTPASNNNRFAWQFGLFYAEPFGIKNLSFTAEFTHLDPFFYSHKSNKTQYTHWGLPLGHGLKPNSDEIAVKLDYWFSSRIYSSIKLQLQRTGEGMVYDESGNLVRNFGSNINHGEGLYLAKAYFLDGDRINNAILTFNLKTEPIKQYFVELVYSGWFINKKFISKNFTDQLIYLTISTDF